MFGGLRLDRIVLLVVLALVLGRMVSSGPYRNGPEIRSDGVGYHAWTRALLAGDFRFCEFLKQDRRMFSYQDAERGICQNKYPIGLALLRFPVMAFLVDDTPGAPLISPAEHLAAGILGALALWLTAALCTWALALLGVSAMRANAVVLLVLFGTGLFHYGTYDGAFTHVYSALICALLCAFGVRELSGGRPVPYAATAVGSFS